MSHEDKSMSIHQPQNGMNPSIQDWLQHPIATIHTQRELALHRAEQSSVARELILMGMTIQLTSYMIQELEIKRLQSQVKRVDMSHDGQLPEDTRILNSLRERLRGLPVAITKHDEKGIIGEVDMALDCLDSWRRIQKQINYEDTEAYAQKTAYLNRARILLTRSPYSDIGPLGYSIDEPTTTTMLAAILYTLAPPELGRDEQVQASMAAYMTHAVKIFLPETVTDFRVMLVDGLLHNFQKTGTMQERLLSLKELLRKPLQKAAERRQITGPSFEN